MLQKVKNYVIQDMSWSPRRTGSEWIMSCGVYVRSWTSKEITMKKERSLSNIKGLSRRPYANIKTALGSGVETWPSLLVWPPSRGPSKVFFPMLCWPGRRDYGNVAATEGGREHSGRLVTFRGRRPMATVMVGWFELVASPLRECPRCWPPTLFLSTFYQSASRGPTRSHV